VVTLRVWFSGDRKSTRLNSSHQIISYAVFCLKKKTRLTIGTVFPGGTLVSRQVRSVQEGYSSHHRSGPSRRDTRLTIGPGPPRRGTRLTTGTVFPGGILVSRPVRSFQEGYASHGGKGPPQEGYFLPGGHSFPEGYRSHHCHGLPSRSEWRHWDTYFLASEMSVRRYSQREGWTFTPWTPSATPSVPTAWTSGAAGASSMSCF